MRAVALLFLALVALSAIVSPLQHQFVPQPTRPMPAVNIP
jgi:hypothetical protein